MRTKLIIIGGRGTALNIAEAVTDAIENHDADLELLGFANDVAESSDLNEYPVVCKLPELTSFFTQEDVKFIYALYKPERMEERTVLLQNLAIPQSKFYNFIHPTAFVSRSVHMGSGNVVLNGAVVSNSVRLGNNNIINSRVVIEHDTVLGHSNFLAAGCVVGAGITIGDGNFIGLHATIRESIQMSNYSFVGMGSVITKNIPAHSTWYGNPARSK